MSSPVALPLGTYLGKLVGGALPLLFMPDATFPSKYNTLDMYGNPIECGGELMWPGYIPHENADYTTEIVTFNEAQQSATKYINGKIIRVKGPDGKYYQAGPIPQPAPLPPYTPPSGRGRGKQKSTVCPGSTYWIMGKMYFAPGN